MVGTIVFSTLENGGGEMMAPFCVAIEQGWGVFGGDGGRIVGRGVSDDTDIVGRNSWHHHL